MINYYNSKVPFGIDCAVSYRLSIIRNMKRLLSLNHMFLQNNGIKLYKSAEHLRDIFAAFLIQKNVDMHFIEENFVKEIILDGKYLMGMFDTYKLKSNRNYKKIHNYNTFVIHGYENGLVWMNCNIGAAASVTIKMTIDELNMIYCDNLNVTNSPNENVILGMPLSVLESADISSPLNKIDIVQCLHNFYSNEGINEDTNIISDMITDKLNNFVTHKYCGYQYTNVANLKTLQDFFKFQNIIIGQSIPEISNNNSDIAKALGIIISLYARYIYTFDMQYIVLILNYLEKVYSIVLNNKKLLEYL